MTTQSTAPTSLAEALDQGIAAANSGATPPTPPADDDTGAPNDTTTTDSAAGASGTDDASGGDAGGDQGGESDAGDGTAADGADQADAAAVDGAGEGDDAADTDASAADSDPKAGTPDGKPVEKKPDHFNDPIPNALKPATKERIRFLASEAKMQRELAETATKERNELITAVTETGATPEQYAGVLDYLALVNSNDRNKQMQAAQFMIRELSALSRVGGFRIPGVTTYSGHKDLEDAVAAGKITEDLAEELAANRSAAAHQGKVGAAQQQASEARAKYAQADQRARAELNTMETEFAKDPLYAQKKPIIVGMLNELIRGDRNTGIPPLHPSKWPAAYKKLYETLPRTLGTPPAARAAPPNNQPLRAQQPAGAQSQAPKSVAEALEMGIEMARGA